MLSPPVAAPKKGMFAASMIGKAASGVASGVSEQQKDLGLLDELFGVCLADLGLAGIVEGDQLDFPAVYAAQAIDRFQISQRAVAHLPPDLGRGAGQGSRLADQYPARADAVFR